MNIAAGLPEWPGSRRPPISLSPNVARSGARKVEPTRRDSQGRRWLASAGTSIGWRTSVTYSLWASSASAVTVVTAADGALTRAPRPNQPVAPPIRKAETTAAAEIGRASCRERVESWVDERQLESK